LFNLCKRAAWKKLNNLNGVAAVHPQRNSANRPAKGWWVFSEKPAD
jgi:hypothetical protein